MKSFVDVSKVKKVKWRHYRIVSDNIRGLPSKFLLNPQLITMGQFDKEFDKLSATGGLTVAEVELHDGTVKYGVTECSPEQNFNKKEGCIKSYFRALNGKKPAKNNSLTKVVSLPEFVKDVLTK
jgi:hypothetical protein